MLRHIVSLYNQMHHLSTRRDLQVSEKLELAIRLRMRARRYIDHWVTSNEKPRIFELLDEFSRMSKHNGH